VGRALLFPRARALGYILTPLRGLAEGAGRGLTTNEAAVTLAPQFTISNAITAGLTAIERARGFLEAATLSEEWMRRMSQRALLLEAHHTTHIEGTHLTIEQAERLWSGETVDDARPEAGAGPTDPSRHYLAVTSYDTKL
jgi:hypothetical protein